MELLQLRRMLVKLLKNNELSPHQATVAASFIKLEPESIRTGYCSQCSMRVALYTHTLMFGQVQALYLIHKKIGVGKDFRLADIIKDRCQFQNIQKLRYLKLLKKRIIKKDKTIGYSFTDTKSKSGYWMLTQKAEDFLLGRISIPAEVLTYKGSLVKTAGKINIRSKLREWKLHKDYAESAIEILRYVRELK